MATLNSPLKTGDEVIVIAGKDKGKRGKITKVITAKDRVIVDGLNIAKRHMKASMNQEPGIVMKEMSLHVSNVMMADPKTGNPTRVGHKVQDGKKVRFAKKSGEVIGESV
jgi:large subunit ribosomal protein L24